MQFDSVTFGLCLVPTLLVYYLTPASYRWLPLLCASYFFYAAGSLAHLGVLVALSVITYGLGIALGGTETRRSRQWVLVVALAPPLAALVGFRWLEARCGHPLWSTIPLGLSFFTLRLMSYLVDVSRRAGAAERHIGRFLAYVGVFPEIPAGPIDRAVSLLPQLSAPPDLRYDLITSGARLFAWGLFKKVVIADRLSAFVDAVYGAPATFDGASHCVATVFFALQIYCDFSGYSDMAIGLGRLFGLSFAKNFDRPYLARTISEFWTRWHISFSSWLRDYLFIPLIYKTDRVLERRLPAGSPTEKLGYSVAALTTMGLCGLWHGSTLNYLAWGLLLGSFMVISVLSKQLRARLARRLYRGRYRRLRNGAKIVTTFALVNVSWVFFRAESIGDAVHILRAVPGGLLSFFSQAASTVVAGGGQSSLLAPFRLGQPGLELAVVACAVMVLWWVEAWHGLGSSERLAARYPCWIRWPLYVGLVLAVAVFRAKTPVTFIYAGF